VRSLLCACFVALALCLSVARAQGPARDQPPVLDLMAEGEANASELRGPIDRFSADVSALRRSYPVRLSPARHERLASFYRDWLDALEPIDFERLSHAGQVDLILFRNHLQRQLGQLEIQKGYQDEARPLIPFAPIIVELAESRRHMQREDGAKAAAALTDLAKRIDEVHKAAEAGLKTGSPRGATAPAEDDAAAATAAATSPTTAAAPNPIRVKKTVANRAAKMVRELRSDLDDWHDFHNGYDPVFTWWVAEPYKQADKALDEYAKFLREKNVGVPEDDNKTIIGDPIGRDALLAELQFEMIPYTPEELIDIAQREFRWCRAEMLKASNELGFGDDWHKALEHVKQQHVEPGEQPALVKELAQEAIKFLDDRDLVTVPDLCREVWRMTMMSPQQQMMSPFFLGGEVIQVAFPTDAMSHEAKLMTLRGNNRHFARATVHHELIPGHHLQGFMTARYRRYREIFDTPFWIEGWALYWEMLLWDLGFPQSPEDRVGLLFWRTHRCVRIIFSLSFHLERMTPQECVDVLVEQVGHERANAEAEVRRSFEGDYGPLYQAAYMLGGLQIRALRQELVDSGKMTNREFHDAILRENSIPIEMLRSILLREELAKDHATRWRFADEP
jgi:uncharacterized protein (DUF885 family)